MPMPPDVLGQLFRRHAPALRLYARQWRDAADDLVQDAFLSLARQPRPPDNVVPWLYRTVRNAALADHRSLWRRLRRENAVRVSEAWFSRTDERLDADEAVHKLATLPLEQREVIAAKLWSGLTFEEIAALVGCSLPTAHRRYKAGLAELRTRLESPCPTTRS